MSHSSIVLNTNDAGSPLSVPASQTAVLLLDYQGLIVPLLSEADQSKSLAGAAALRDWARSHGALIVHGLIDIETPIFATAKSRARFESHIERARSLPEAGLVDPQLRPERDTANEVTLKRTIGQISCLKLRGIEELLRQRGIKSLVIGGISTSGCVLRTSLSAADEGFITTIVEDACADPDQAVHDTVLGKIVVANVNVTNVKEWNEAWEKKGKA